MHEGASLPPLPLRRAWVADTIGVWIAEGWLYLAVIVDISSRMVFGWAMDAHREAVLVENAKLDGTGASASGARFDSHHADRGSQYTCHD